MSHLRFFLLLALLTACTAGSDSDDEFLRCTTGESMTHACNQYGGTCIDSTANCVGGQWQCPEGFEYSGEPCRPEPTPTPDAGLPDADPRDCSEYGGGQAILAQRCSDDIVEYCIYSDTTQTASWSEIESCSAPFECIVKDDVAICQDSSGPQP